MSNLQSGPRSLRARIVFFIWNNMPRFLLLALIALAVILAGAIKQESELIAADKENGLKQERPAVNGVILTLAPATIRDRINLPGSIEPWTTLNLLSKLSGMVEKVLVREGQVVKKGDILAMIEAEDYRIALERARAAYTLARAEYDRDRAIYSKGIIPTAELDAKRTQMETARADLDNAELQLSRCTVTSPMNGVVRKLDAKVGLQLSVGDPIAEILEIDRVKAVVGIPESDVTAVRGLSTVDVEVQALGDKVITGRVHFLSASPETVARLYRLELALDNDGGELLPGMFVRADIVKRTVADAVVVPFYSVISRGDSHYVFVEREGAVEKRSVKLGIMEKWTVEVTQGLAAGDRLLVEGHRDVEDRQKVKVVKAFSDIKDLSL